jgi:dipeptide/tripeptide permease
VVVFTIGEMIASPKSQEYVAAIAPKSKTAMYMGYYFVSMALGNLFAGLLSGWAYTALAKEMNQPMLMWALFGAIGAVTALALLIFNQYLKKQNVS